MKNESERSFQQFFFLFEKNRVWKEVHDSIQIKDFKKADVAKQRLENLQRKYLRVQHDPSPYLFVKVENTVTSSSSNEKESNKKGENNCEYEFKGWMALNQMFQQPTWIKETEETLLKE